MFIKLCFCAALCAATLAAGQTVSLAPSTLSFAAQVVGTSSAAKPVVLTNTSKTTRYRSVASLPVATTSKRTIACHPLSLWALAR